MQTQIIRPQGKKITKFKDFLAQISGDVFFNTYQATNVKYHVMVAFQSYFQVLVYTFRDIIQKDKIN